MKNEKQLYNFSASSKSHMQKFEELQIWPPLYYRLEASLLNVSP